VKKVFVSTSAIWIERSAWAAGIAALTWCAVAIIAGTVGSHRELERFAVARLGAGPDIVRPDLSLWSSKRVNAWRETHKREAPLPLAVLRIPRLRLEVPVLAGTDEWTLNRAVGHIEDTARPGADGNAGIAGHRDGFFRGLKDIRSGDVLEVETLASVQQYQVERTWIVEDEDVSVLDPTATPSVTLVTCYPFYFVGAAPQRFIVRAIRTSVVIRN
jgi:sortase A